MFLNFNPLGPKHGQLFVTDGRCADHVANAELGAAFAHSEDPIAHYNETTEDVMARSAKD